MKFSIGLMIGCLAITGVYAATDADKVVVPFRLAKGKNLFDQNCSACHGKQLEGTAQGPSFIHPYYRPNHHDDGAFYRAPLSGITAHHWRFGNMPPVPGMTREKLDSIIPYIRYYQQQKKLY